jgi:hypothetical protein
MEPRKDPFQSLNSRESLLHIGFELGGESRASGVGVERRAMGHLEAGLAADADDFGDLETDARRKELLKNCQRGLSTCSMV